MQWLSNLTATPVWQLLYKKGFKYGALCEVCQFKRGLGWGRVVTSLEMRDFHEGDTQEVATDDAGESRACVRPPLGHPHLADHVTNGAFWKLSFSRGTRRRLINKSVSERGDIL